MADYCARFVSFAFSLRLLNIQYQVYPSFAVTISDWLYVHTSNVLTGDSTSVPCKFPVVLSRSADFCVVMVVCR